MGRLQNPLTWSELCPSGVDPQRGPDGNIKWCRLDAECRESYQCVAIVGLYHFGTAVKYCCPTKCECPLPRDLHPSDSYCSKKPRLTDMSSCATPPVTRFYFDTWRLKCRPFVVAACSEADRGVDEVQNRFGTLKDCRAKCETTGEKCETSACLCYSTHCIKLQRVTVKLLPAPFQPARWASRPCTRTRTLTSPICATWTSPVRTGTCAASTVSSVARSAAARPPSVSAGPVRNPEHSRSLVHRWTNQCNSAQLHRLSDKLVT